MGVRRITSFVAWRKDVSQSTVPRMRWPFMLWARSAPNVPRVPMALGKMDAADAILVRAWALSVEDASDQVMDELEALLPALVAAGYAEADEHILASHPEGRRASRRTRARRQVARSATSRRRDA
jgi:hypothetical protein